MIRRTLSINIILLLLMACNLDAASESIPPSVTRTSMEAVTSTTTLDVASPTPTISIRAEFATLAMTPGVASPTRTYPPVDISTLAGTWQGVIEITGETTGRQMVLTLTTGSEDTITGDLIITGSGILEEYHVEGLVSGNQVRFEESGGRKFWGTFDGGSITGSAGWDCYECSAWGSFTLGRDAPPSTGEVSFTGLTDEGTVQVVNGRLGPQVEVEVQASSMVQGGRLYLEVDGLMMDMKRSTSAGTFSTVLTWWPWRGDGEYELTLTSWPEDLCCRQAVQSIKVTVSGFPASQPTITQRFIDIYRTRFGLNLSTPLIGRYLKPIKEAVDESRWVSVAYVADKMYEINLFDYGTFDSYFRPINHAVPGAAQICKPVGEYDMLVTFVDYGNTGITRGMAMTSLAEGEARYNEFYRQQALSAGSSKTLLQVHTTSVFLDDPVHAGQVLTPAQITAETGVDTSQYDLLVQLDLDANMSVAQTMPGLGFGGTGCYEGGSPYIDIYFVVTSPEEINFSGTIFDHELSHSLGWMHWWPVADMSVATQATTDFEHNSTFPTYMFGWMDVDGDGIVEILDPTPYGLVP